MGKGKRIRERRQQKIDQRQREAPGIKLRVYGRLQNAIDKRPRLEILLRAGAEAFLRNPAYTGGYRTQRPYELYTILQYADINNCYVSFRKLDRYTVVYLWQGRGDVVAFSYRDLLTHIKST